jgi:hypothetical protein
MAVPTNTFEYTSQVGIRESLADYITNVDPADTPFFSMCRKESIQNKYHEWQTDVYRAPADNKHIDGDDTVADAATATTRVGNRTQIFKNAVAIPDGDASTKKAGRGSEMKYQLLKIGKEIRMDVELALFANNAQVAGTSSVAAELGGLGSWVATNTSAGSGGSDPTGDGTDARTDGTQRGFSQTLTDTVMQNIWDSGGKPNTMYLTSFQYDVALGFTGMNNQRATINASKDEVRNTFEVYVTPWGRIKLLMTYSDRQRARDVYILQDDMWCVGVKRPFNTKRLASQGDNEKMQVLSEVTLIAKNEKASGLVADLSTS